MFFSHRVVVIDDSPTTCAVIRRVLEREWWVVETYLRPLPALQALWQADRPPCALILDIGLPQLDGYQVAHQVRTKAPATLRPLPIIGLSGRDGTLDRLKGRLVGMDAYLVKPFDPTELLALLSRLLVIAPTDECMC